MSRLTIFFCSRSIKRPGVATIMCTPLWGERRPQSGPRDSCPMQDTSLAHRFHPHAILKPGCHPLAPCQKTEQLKPHGLPQVLLFDGLHLLLDRHAPDAEGAAQRGQPILLQQTTVVLQDAVGLPGQLPLRRQTQLIPTPLCRQNLGLPLHVNHSLLPTLTEGQMMSP